MNFATSLLTIGLVGLCAVALEEKKTDLKDLKDAELSERLIRVGNEKFAKTQELILKRDPEIQRATLEEDKKVLFECAKRVIPIYKERGFKDVQAFDAVSIAWHKLRVDKPAVPLKGKLDKEKTVALILEYGYLEITSTPDQAKVFVNGEPWEPTNTGRFIPAEKHKIRLVKEGYEPIDEEVLVEKLKLRTFSRVLKKKQEQPPTKKDDEKEK